MLTARSIASPCIVGPATMRSRRRSGWWLILLAVPFVALLFPAFYARATPALAGLPFFYWYQFAWLVVSAGLTALVAARTR